MLLFALFQSFFAFMFLFAYLRLIQALLVAFSNGVLNGCGENVPVCKFSACAISHDMDSPKRLEEGVLPLMVV